MRRRSTRPDPHPGVLVRLGGVVAAGAAVMVLALLGGSARPATAAGGRPRTVPPTTAPPATVPTPSTTVPEIDPETGLPTARGPLVVLPAGCVSPDPPLAVFVGRVSVAVSTAARFDVLRVLTGSLAGYQIGGQVDVHYGDETRFLQEGAEYVVGVRSEPNSGRLVSTVREAAPLFGGDAVVGLDDSAIDCVALDDPVRTLMPDGTSVDTGVLTPLRGKGTQLLLAVLKPLAVALGVLLALVMVKHLLFGMGRALRDASTTEPLTRSRSHVASGRAQRRP